MRRKAIESGEIEQALQTALPLTATESVKDLALLLAAAANGEIPLEDAQRQLAQNPIFQHILRTLGDQTVRLTNSLLAFGENSQTGDVSIKDMAGNDIISLTINISHTTQASSISTNRLVLALILSSLIVAISFIFTDVLMQNRTSLSSNSNISTPTAPKNTTEPTAQISDTSISSPNSVCKSSGGSLKI
jgi:hypothetical protein